MNIYERAHKDLSLSIYSKASQELKSWELDLNPPKDQYILRMPILTPEYDRFLIPSELEWIYPSLNRALYGQSQLHVGAVYIYVTVRSGLVRSVDDDVWHVDGFSMRTPHRPEQNYIWSDMYGTEFLPQNFDIPADFDPMRHNLHTFIQDRASVAPVTLTTGRLYQIDPYHVHRRPTVPEGTQRTFLRISFVPVEIEDDTCMPNPLAPRRAPYNRNDIRKTLIRY